MKIPPIKTSPEVQKRLQILRDAGSRLIQTKKVLKKTEELSNEAIQITKASGKLSNFIKKLNIF